MCCNPCGMAPVAGAGALSSSRPKRSARALLYKSTILRKRRTMMEVWIHPPVIVQVFSVDPAAIHFGDCPCTSLSARTSWPRHIRLLPNPQQEPGRPEIA